MSVSVLDGIQVSLRQIHHVNVITNASAIRCGVVVTKDTQVFSSANRDLCHIGHEIVGNTVGVFANLTRGMSTHWIEVSQDNHGPIRLGTTQGFRIVKVTQNLFDHVFRTTVGIGNADPNGGIFRNGHFFGRTVDRCRGRKDNRMATKFIQKVQQDKGSRKIVLVILERNAGAFADGLQSSKVNARVELGRLFKDCPEGFFVAHVDIVKDNPFFTFFGTQTDDFGHTIQGNFRRVTEIIDNGDIVAILQQEHDRMAADVATPTSDQNIWTRRSRHCLSGRRRLC
mmetsp:Transcript_11229/g.21411  ORF Transcript_11229/g.21411 Transcript_11229/m.21411 type:complete len:284 (+) Transcript_11229:476-1327(+)